MKIASNLIMMKLLHFIITIFFSVSCFSVSCGPLFSGVQGHKDQYFGNHFVSYSPQKGTLLYSRGFQEGGYDVQVLKTVKILKDPGENVDANKPDGREISKFVEDLVEHLKGNYPRRGWTQENINGFSDNITELFYDSDFIVIRDRNGEIQASLRLIKSSFIFPISQTTASASILLRPTLPFEKFSGTQAPILNLDTPSFSIPGVSGAHRMFTNVEISSLAINPAVGQPRQLNKLLFKYFLFITNISDAEITFNRSGELEERGYNDIFGGLTPLGSMANQILLSEDSDNFLYAYGDRVGRLMYKPFGMIPDQNFTEVAFRNELWSVISASRQIWASPYARNFLKKETQEAFELVWEELNVEAYTGLRFSDREIFNFNDSFGLGEVREMILSELRRRDVYEGVPINY